jgi:3-hydroxyacyl-[acyl-carrier-protein] dehydratase
MTLANFPEVAAMLRLAARCPIVAAEDRRERAAASDVLDKGEIERLIPHRDPFLFIDRVEYVDHDTSTIVCRHDLERVPSVERFVAGHFPGRPLWPGVLQVEAIGQAGLCLAMLMDEAQNAPVPRNIMLTHILGAEFVRPVSLSGSIEVITRMLSDGLFDIFVGQCLQGDAVCCAAAVRGISEGREKPA